MLFKLVKVFIFLVRFPKEREKNPVNFIIRRVYILLPERGLPDELRRIHPYTPRDRGTRTGIVAMGGGVMLTSGWMLPPGS